ncbi:hypothetical protein JR316_0012984 [Psilocybe cubensis]|nr:hypothetical protein JR316_0012984 [Psilocybe cubensis]KAH9474523.1 hypothetical protein JR316_0012984 [Psilocybe cubensis]
MCNAANLTAFFSSAKFMATKGDKLTPAPMLRRSIFVLGSLLAVSYIVAAADAWLHASSTGIVIPSISAYTGSALPQFGREINETMCQEASVFDTDAVGHITAASCGILNPGSGGSGNKLAEGIRVLSNSSTLQRVVFTDDQTALLVPQNLPSNITYEAQAVGVKSQCTSITKYCIYITSDYGPNAFLNLDCSKGGINYQNSSAQTQIPPLCALDGQGVCTIGIDIPSNPFTAAEVVTSFAYLNPGQPLDQFIGNTGWFVHGNKGAWNVVFCNITALDVTYTYTSSQFVVQKAVPKSVTDTQHIMAAGFEGQTTAISQQVDGAGSDPNTGTYEQAYALELSRQMLARGAFLYEPNDVIRIQSEKSIIGSNLQVAPLVLFVAALVLFSLQVLWITLRIIIAAWNVQFVELAALFLSNPLTVVQMLYGQPNPELTWNKNVEQRFKDETDLDRLQVGPVYTEQGSFFTVTKASV